MTILKTLSDKNIFYFTAIVLTFSALICAVSYQLNDPNISILTVVTPALLALILTAKTKGKLGVKELFVSPINKKISYKWILISLFGIPLLVSLAILTTINFDFTKFNLRTTQLMPQFFVILVIAVGEEYGWRGFLLPRLMEKFSFFYSNILLALIWGLWHFPAYLIGTGVPQQMNFIVFLLWVVLGTFYIGWIYYYTRNVLTSILIHFSVNAAFNYLTILPEFTGSMIAFWTMLLYGSVFMAFVLYLCRKDLVLNAQRD